MFDPYLYAWLAKERYADLLREAEQYRLYRVANPRREARSLRAIVREWQCRLPVVSSAQYCTVSAGA